MGQEEKQGKREQRKKGEIEKHRRVGTNKGISSEQKLKQGVKAANLLTTTSLLLTITKVIIGLITNSVVLLMDALHNGADLLTSIASLVGLKIAQRKPNKRFPYGYYKAENIAAFLIALFIIYGAVEGIIEGIKRISESTSLLRMPLLALITAFISIIVSYYIANHTRKIGERINSQSLIANGKERLLDAVSSLIVLIAIIFSYYKINYVEGISTIIIALFVLKIGFETIWESTLSLMDYNPRESKEVEGFLKKKEKELGRKNIKIRFDGLKLRRAGPFLLGEVKVIIPEGINFKVLSERLNEIKEEVTKKFNLESLLIIPELERKRIVRVVIPLTNNELSEHFARASEFLIVRIDTKNKKVLEESKVNNKFLKKPVRAGLSVANDLIKRNIDYLITKEIGEISLHTLRDNSVIVLKASSKDVKKLISDFMNNKLLLFEKASRKKE